MLNHDLIYYLLIDQFYVDYFMIIEISFKDNLIQHWNSNCLSCYPYIYPFYQVNLKFYDAYWLIKFIIIFKDSINSIL